MLATKQSSIGLLAFILLGIILSGCVSGERSAGDLDAFAQCLTDEGAVMYGAYWCPHCADQKEGFGTSVDLIKYVECSLPGGKGQTAECNDAGITGYPTWEFKDGSRLSGNISHSTLAEKTGCSLT
jgi:hypothetical protein